MSADSGFISNPYSLLIRGGVQRREGCPKWIIEMKVLSGAANKLIPCSHFTRIPLRIDTENCVLNFYIFVAKASHASCWVFSPSKINNIE